MAVMRTILGLLVPANLWSPVRRVALPIADGEVGFARLRELIDCRTVEVIGYYPAPNQPDFTFVMFGDEEARMVLEPHRNLRASMLAGHSIVGDVVLLGHDNDMHRDIEVPSSIIPTLRSY